MGNPTGRREESQVKRERGKSGKMGLENSNCNQIISSGNLSLFFIILFLGSRTRNLLCSRIYLLDERIDLSGSFLSFLAGPFAGRNPPAFPRQDNTIRQVYLGNWYHLFGAPWRGCTRWTPGLFWSLLCMFLIFLHPMQMDTVSLFIEGVCIQ